MLMAEQVARALELADRAVRKSLPKAMRARKLNGWAERLEGLPELVDAATSRAGPELARRAFYTARRDRDKHPDNEIAYATCTAARVAWQAAHVAAYAAHAPYNDAAHTRAIAHVGHATQQIIDGGWPEALLLPLPNPGTVPERAEGPAFCEG